MKLSSNVNIKGAVPFKGLNPIKGSELLKSVSGLSRNDKINLSFLQTAAAYRYSAQITKNRRKLREIDVSLGKCKKRMTEHFTSKEERALVCKAWIELEKEATRLSMSISRLFEKLDNVVSKKFII